MKITKRKYARKERKKEKKGRKRNEGVVQKEPLRERCSGNLKFMGRRLDDVSLGPLPINLSFPKR